MPYRPLDPDEIDRHTRWLRGLARALVRGEDRADDLVQETWLRHASASAGVAPDRDRMAGILRGLSRHAWRAESRREHRERAAARAEAAPASDELAARLELSERLVREVSALPEEQRTAVLLRYFDGLSSAEIARRLDLPGATVRSRLKRGLDELRRRLEDDDEGRGATLLALVPWADGPRPSAIATAVTGGTLMTAMQLKVIVGTVVLGLLGVGGWALRGAGGGDPAAPGPAGGSVGESAVVLAEVEAPALEPRRDASGAGSSSGETNHPDGPFRARLIDAATGEPVPHYVVRLVADSGEEEQLESAADGTLQSGDVWPAGPLMLEALDLEPGLGWHEQQERVQLMHVPSADPLEVEVRVGPTYRLATTLPAGLAPEDLEAELVPGKPGSLILAPHARLRAGAEPWVRYFPAALHFPGAGPWSLVVRSDDGLWYGAAAVQRNPGVQPGLVALTLEARARLAVRLTREGAPIEEGGASAPRVYLTGSTELAAGYTPGLIFDHVVAGEYEVRVEDPRYRAATAKVELVAGATGEVVLDLEPLGGLASVAGVLRSDAGPLAIPYVAVMLVPESGGGALQLDLDLQGAWTEVPFRIEDVPPGSYELHVHAPGYDANPEPLPVAAGDEGIVAIFGAETVERIEFRVEVRDAMSDEPVRYASVTCWDGDGWSGSTALGRNTLTLEGRVGGSEEWMIRAVGYQPWWGTQADLDPEAATIVELNSGWGTVVRARDEAKQPLVGVAVLLDGVVAGKTGADGRVRVLHSERPERIAVDADVWELVPGYVIDSEGKFEDRANGITLTLHPASD